MNVTVVEGLAVTVLPNERHEFLMTTKEVAAGYGVSEYNIRQHKMQHPLELIEGKHFVSAVSIPNGGSNIPHNATLWTKRGIVRLGFFIKSERARLFRDWAEELIIRLDEQRDLFGEVIPVVAEKKRREHNRLSKDRLVDILTEVAKVEDKALRLLIIDKLTNY